MTDLEEKLAGVLAAIEPPADFDRRLTARVRALEADEKVRRLAARAEAEANFREAGQGLVRGRRLALRLFSLDAIAGGTLLIGLVLALAQFAPRLGASGPLIVILAMTLATAGFGAFTLLRSQR